MMIHEKITVYRADAIRAENGSQSDMPTFGRFAAVVREDTYRLIESKEGWHCDVPGGSTLWSGDGAEEETREAWGRIVASLAQGAKDHRGWTTDRDRAKREAIAIAAQRHNARAAASRGYAQKFGGEVTIARREA